MKQKSVQIIVLILITLFINHDDKKRLFYQNINKIKDVNSNLILVNKFNQLPKNYIPYDLEKLDVKYANNYKYVKKEVKQEFEKLSEDARKLGYQIIAVSTFRSYGYQENLYQYYVLEKGKKYADNCSARPGHSEHQTGLAIDVMGENMDYNKFEQSNAFAWMKTHAHKYGFILRYPSGKEHITGFKYEPWHYRYVGKKASKEIYQKQITLEEYLHKK